MCVKPIPVAPRSKTWLCGRTFTGIAGSNSTGGKDMSHCVLCFRFKSLIQADHSPRGVLPSVILKPLSTRAVEP
jgi:hypothetical protein